MTGAFSSCSSTAFSLWQEMNDKAKRIDNSLRYLILIDLLSNIGFGIEGFVKV